MGFSQDYLNVEQWQRGKPYSPPARVKHNGNIFDLKFGQDETYEPAVGDASDKGGWQLYDELYDQTAPTQPDQPKIIGYIPTWRKDEGFNYANEEMYQYITHGIIAFLMFSEVNRGEFEPNSLKDVYAILSDVVNAGHRKGTRISVALGGSTDYGFLALMTSIGDNPASPLLDHAVQNVVNFVNSNDLDGVDLDLECWWDRNGDPAKDQGGRYLNMEPPPPDAGEKKGEKGPHPAGFALTLFAQQLKHAMPDKLVSATVFGTSWYGNNYDAKIAEYVDWLAIMTYDLTGSWPYTPVGPHTALHKIRYKSTDPLAATHVGPFQEDYQEEQQGSWPPPNSMKTSSEPMVDNPIFSVEDTLWYWTNPSFVNWQGSGQKIPRNKIVAGVPIYGYDFAYEKDPDKLTHQVPPGYKIIRYKDLLTQFPDALTHANANIKVTGSTPRPPFISAPGNYAFTNNIYFETPDTAVAKWNFLTNVGVHGVIVWELSNDVWEEGKSITKALYRHSGNPETRPALPPSGKTPVPSDALTVIIEQIGSYTTEFASEIAQGREKETSRLPLLVEPSLVGAITQFFKDAGKPDGKGINADDAGALIGWWRSIEEDARQYQIDSPGAPSRITDLKDKVDQLVQQVESRMREEDGWLFVPFYSLIASFDAHILLEGFVRQNPPQPEPDKSEDKQKQCEREADDVSQKIQQFIDVLTNALQKWPTMDLGPVGAVLGIPTIRTPAPPPVEPPPPPVEPPPPPVGHRYSVRISMQRIPVLAHANLTIEVDFGTSDQVTNVPDFYAVGDAPLGLPLAYDWQGTARLNYEVERLAKEGWNATLDLTTGQEMQLHLRGLSGEDIGVISWRLSGEDIGVISDIRRGTFRLIDKGHPRPI